MKINKVKKRFDFSNAQKGANCKKGLGKPGVQEF